MANLKRWKDVSVSNKTRKMFLNFQKKIFSQFLFLKSLFKVTENVEFAFAIISCYSSSYWIILNEKKYYYYLIRQMSSWENVDCPLFTILSDLAWLLPIHLLPPSPLLLIRPLFKVIFVSTIVRTVEKLSTKTWFALSTRVSHWCLTMEGRHIKSDGKTISLSIKACGTPLHCHGKTCVTPFHCLKRLVWHPHIVTERLVWHLYIVTERLVWHLYIVTKRLVWLFLHCHLSNIRRWSLALFNSFPRGTLSKKYLFWYLELTNVASIPSSF